MPKKAVKKKVEKVPYESLTLERWLQRNVAECLVIGQTDDGPPVGTLVTLAGLSSNGYGSFKIRCQDKDNKTYVVPFSHLSAPLSSKLSKIYGDFIGEPTTTKVVKVGQATQVKKTMPNLSSLVEETTPAIKVTSTRLILNDAAELILGVGKDTGVAFFLETYGPRAGEIYIAPVPKEMKAHFMEVDSGVITIINGGSIYKVLKAVAGPTTKDTDDYVTFAFWKACYSEAYPDIPMYRVITPLYSWPTSQVKKWGAQYLNKAEKLYEALGVLLKKTSPPSVEEEE